MRPTDACPCGSGAPYGGCCGPLHHGERSAETAEYLMRSRFSAYAVGDLDYIWRTWHPRTRPDTLTPDAALEWTALDILDVVAGGADDDHGEVEFRAHYVQNRRSGTLHERSRFAVRARRWFYVDGALFE
ncbi:YchJ family metal-binding protein [Mycobacterium sp. NPDC050551]|uniref:YchJ family protein n=1 Tax=Mycobacterium sp. NPDC050551 TaxID=3155407 RepID=UPI00342AB9E2